MVLNLFRLAGLAILGWLLLIFLPTWRVTRRLAQGSFFPVYLAMLYAIGVGSMLVQFGPGFMKDFGSPEGVTRLLARQDIALIAWIHILAFDQVIGLWIYRENMKHRFVPIPVQSLLLFSTLMLGPIGFLAFYLLKLARQGTDALEPIAPAPVRAEPTPLSAPGWTHLSSPRSLLGLWREERWLTRISFLGIALGIGCAIAMLVRGRYIPPEGDLYKPAAFNVAVGMYFLSIIPWLSLAGFSDSARLRWRRWMIGVAAYSYAIETIQQLRGVDPRFSQAEPVSQIFGLVFLMTATGIAVAFITLALRFFNARVEGRAMLMVLAARYASAATAIGFVAGYWISANQSRITGPRGNILPLHAAGFHALQAIPLVALLLMWSAVSVKTSMRWVHAAGIAWLTLCVALWWHIGQGLSVFESSPGQSVGIAAGVVWALCFLRAVAAWAAAPASVATTT